MAGRGAWLVATATAIAVIVGVVLWRPGPDGSGGADRADRSERIVLRLSAALGHPAGSAAVDVGAGHDLHGYPYVATVVTLAASATPSQVVDVIEALPAMARSTGLPDLVSQRGLSFVTAAGARLTVAWEPWLARAQLTSAVRAWLAVSRGLADRADVSASVLTGGGIDLRLGLGVVRSSAAVLQVYRAGEGLADLPTAAWDVSAVEDGAVLRLTTQGALTARDERGWSDLLDATHRLRRPLRLSRLEVAFGNRVESHLAVLAPTGVADDDFTPRAYGADVRPVARAQLATLSRLTSHWSFFLSWARRSSSASEHLAALLFGDQGQVVDNTAGSAGAPRGWAAALTRPTGRGA